MAELRARIQIEVSEGFRGKLEAFFYTKNKIKSEGASNTIEIYGGGITKEARRGCPACARLTKETGSDEIFAGICISSFRIGG